VDEHCYWQRQRQWNTAASPATGQDHKAQFTLPLTNACGFCVQTELKLFCVEN